MTSCTLIHQPTRAAINNVKFYLFIYEEAISKSCEESTSNFVMIKKFNFIYNQSDILFNIVKDHKKRLLDVDSKEMERVVAQARGSEVLFESNSSEHTMIKDGTTAAQAELWNFFG